MNRAQSNEPDQPVSSTVSITVLSVTPARAKKLFAFASVEIDIDGVQIGVHGIRVMREDGGTAIELPKFRDTGGVWRVAITLPEEVHSPIANQLVRTRPSALPDGHRPRHSARDGGGRRKGRCRRNQR